MRLLFLLTFLIASISNSLVKADSDVGCGLGSMIFKENSIISAVFRLTTNHSFSTQLFGITTGTSGCSQHSIVQNEKMPIYYAEANFDRLKIELAQGEGEYLSGLATVLGCKQDSINLFNSYLQKNYKELIPNEKTTPIDLIRNVDSSIQNHSLLKQTCNKVIL